MNVQDLNNADLKRELKIINILSQNPKGSQRDIAQQSGFSLGMVNVTIKRLVSKGLIKLNHVSAKSIYYTLTKKGITAKIKEVVRRINNNFHSTRRIFEILEKLVINAKSEGYNKFVLIGKGDIFNVAEFYLKNFKDLDYQTIKSIKDAEQFDKNCFYINTTITEIPGAVFLLELITKKI